MSGRLMGEVFARSRHGGIELLMLLAIAEHANDDGSNAYPSVPSLAAKCRTSVRYAHRVLAGLRASGELQVQANGGPHGTNVYRITLPLTCRSAPTPDLQATPGAAVTLTHRPPTPDLQVPDPLTYRPDEPSLNRQEPPESARKRAAPPMNKPKATARKTALSPDFGVSSGVRAWAAKRGFGDLEAHLEAFALKCAALGYKYLDWDAAFKTAIRDDWAKLRDGQRRQALDADETFA